MTLAPTLTATRSRLRFSARALDASILIVFLIAAAALILQGGAEALLGSAIGAAIGSRSGRGAFTERVLGGAYAGFYACAMFAAFFHSAIVALVFQLI
jgi:hypothetical protein